LTVAASVESRNGLIKIAAAGVVSGVLTPLLPPLIDSIRSTDRAGGDPVRRPDPGAAMSVWRAGVAVGLGGVGRTKLGCPGGRGGRIAFGQAPAGT
jgi:hypothetical protein